MSDTVVVKKKEAGPVQLVVTLFLISAICAVLLGLVNNITAGPIAAANEAATNAAMQAVLPADSYEQVEYTGGNALVTAVYKAGDAGYVVQVAPSGFGGNLDVMVGVGADGTCTGVSIISHAETSGLGANATKEDFRAQFVGKANVAVTKDGGDIAALTGATITSRAVCDGVNAAIEAAASVG
ncbi:RnfABCDGE type electron transport complex subunit G [Intestinimonas aquisgranensis]|uniref:RnfABCDGE type electron transport complex subunit G n=1 Tax=Intestinimonas timonensis TaxID=1689270 RepID=UPI001D0E420E|nr:RnfABCDGE type electron transport complex subunit G [Intestinimonas timonensis]MCC2258755.1 RnfABCDGE type electron transport complex subunit G [Intestinimonas aquisgranensis]HIY16332.1 RnfABCDGE type electron transport complex subunit G [Candidatus Intestinimonas stercorigallinarum]